MPATNAQLRACASAAEASAGLLLGALLEGAPALEARVYTVCEQLGPVCQDQPLELVVSVLTLLLVEALEQLRGAPKPAAAGRPH